MINGNHLHARLQRIWIATHNGVARYDGRRFTVFNRANTPQLPANDTRALYETKDGSLWIGTIGGLARYQKGRPGVFERFPEFDGNSVHAIFEDDSGKLWLGTREETWAKDSSTSSRFEIVERMPDRVKAFCQDKEGRLWLGADSGVYVLGGMLERLSHHRLPVSDESTGQIPSAGVNVLLADDEGGVWIGANRGMLYVRDSVVWVGTDGPTWRSLDRTLFEVVMDAPNIVFNYCEDSHDTLWIAAGNGLYKVTPSGFQAQLDLPAEATPLRILANDDGTMWIGTTEGLFHFYDGIFELRLPGFIWDILQTRTGGLFVIATAALHRLVDDTFEPLTEFESMVCLAEDREGGLWVGKVDGEGLHYYRNQRVRFLSLGQRRPFCLLDSSMRIP